MHQEMRNRLRVVMISGADLLCAVCVCEPDDARAFVASRVDGACAPADACRLFASAKYMSETAITSVIIALMCIGCGWKMWV